MARGTAHCTARGRAHCTARSRAHCTARGALHGAGRSARRGARRVAPRTARRVAPRTARRGAHCMARARRTAWRGARGIVILSVGAKRRSRRTATQARPHRKSRAQARSAKPKDRRRRGPPPCETQQGRRPPGDNRLTPPGRIDILRGFPRRPWAVSSVGEHFPDTEGVIGSIPIPPTIFQKPYSRRAFLLLREPGSRRNATPVRPRRFP
jgi:hypothetical protein